MERAVRVGRVIDIVHVPDALEICEELARVGGLLVEPLGDGVQTVLDQVRVERGQLPTQPRQE